MAKRAYDSPFVSWGAVSTWSILHGLCTFGVAGHAVLKTYCGYKPERLAAMQLRFSAPVYPGETLRTEMWRQDNTVSFRAKALDRDVVVLDNGKIELAG